MSNTNIPVKVRLLLSAKAAGRCQFRGCNRQLTTHELSRHQTRFGAYAHIVADSPDGPRGDPLRSPLLAKAIENLMLLCQDCHKNIDHNVDDFPETLLLAMKAEHEARILAVTEHTGLTRTHLLLLEAGIGTRAGLVDEGSARLATLPRWAFERPTRIQLAKSRLRDGEKAFWYGGVLDIQRAVDEVKRDFSEKSISHVSVFALAPIPLLIWLGYHLGDLIPGEAFQLSRGKHGWAWLDAAEGLDITIDDTAPVTKGKPAVLLLCISGEVEIPEELLELESRRVGAVYPAPDIVQTRIQVEAFMHSCRQAMAAMAGASSIHVISAIPNSLAVEFGRLQLPKSHPPLRIWDRHEGNAGLRPVLELSGGKTEIL